MMRLFLIVLAAAVLINLLGACKSSAGHTLLCDTACLKDTLKFVNTEHPQKPYVYISAANCKPDTVMWSFENMGMNRKISFNSLFGDDLHINKDYISCYIRDTLYAWLKFNDCSTSRGYLVKIPYNRKEKMYLQSSALNSYDPRFAIADGLIAYTDRGNIFAEDVATGQKAMMTFGSRVEIDYDVIHETVDSVSVTRNRIWARVKMGDAWKTFEKNVEFK